MIKLKQRLKRVLPRLLALFLNMTMVVFREKDEYVALVISPEGICVSSVKKQFMDKLIGNTSGNSDDWYMKEMFQVHLMLYGDQLKDVDNYKLPTGLDVVMYKQLTAKEFNDLAGEMRLSVQEGN